ncbi:DUF4225 domain-containing protein [Pantoea sp. BAV 3049]|uniref:DUF4225 domain-containing protein n=1 Tax=Pantoea sp. BAV 3049 TaxID=2654188 RepID=UPI00131D93BF|nr:DUF4225 domain-containing protein [Pantoea sp. BAV 3049]
MDNYLAKNRFSDYFLTMANLEARQLSSLAARLADRHLKNAIVRSDFKDDIQNFIAHQLQTIRSAKSDSQCRQCVSNLQQERAYLDTQDRHLAIGSAQIVATAQFVEKNGVWGYVINGVGVVVSGLQFFAGLGVAIPSVLTGNVIGFAFGSMLVLHGLNGVQEGILNLKSGKDDAEGYLKEQYINTATFLGFDEKTGRLAYSYTDLFLSAYGMSRLVLKPNSWRLFHYLNADYVRNIKNMSRTNLAIEMGSDALTIKSIYKESHN